MAKSNDAADQNPERIARPAELRVDEDWDDSVILDEEDFDLTSRGNSKSESADTEAQSVPLLPEAGSQPDAQATAPSDLAQSIPPQKVYAQSAGSQLCPRCMQNVSGFIEQVRGTDIQHVCPTCSETVQFRYARDYHQVSRVKLSLAGMSGHGKTMFLRGIYTQLTTLGRKWRGFHFSPLSDDDARIFRTAVGDSNRGELADPSQLTERPVGFELNGIPGAGNVHLLLYDISGEAFDSSTKLGRHAFFIPKSEVVTLILSLSDIASGHDLAFLLSRLVDAIRGKDEDPAKKSLVVVLTKGDRLRSEEALPQSAETFLLNEAASDPRDLSGLQQLSDDLENWLRGHHGDYWNFVEAAKKQFQNVRYTVISSTGSDPGPSGAQVQMSPRNVISPLLWLLRFSLPAVHVNSKGRETTFYDLGEALQTTIDSPVDPTIVTLDRGHFHLKKAIELNSSIELKGAGQDLTQVFVESELKVTGGTFAASGITFQAPSLSPGNVLSIADAGLDISDCKFMGARRNFTSKTFGHGLQVTGLSSGKIELCRFVGNQGNGLHVAGTSKLSVTLSVSHENGIAGLRFGVSSRLKALQNKSYDNEVGIITSGDAKADLKNNTCCNNKNCGISYRGNAKGMAQGNTCSNDPQVSDHLHQLSGILVSDQAQVDLSSNKCLRNIGDGIQIDLDAVCLLRGNSARSNQRNGIGVYQRANASLEANTCDENCCGIYIEKTSKGTKVAKSNSCSDNLQHGIKDLRSWRWLI